MSYIFSKILEMSLYGSIAIGAVMLFRTIFRKCPRRVLILFWLAVAFRLICPFNFASPTSVLNIGHLFPAKVETPAADVLPEYTGNDGQAVITGSQGEVPSAGHEVTAADGSNEAAVNTNTHRTTVSNTAASTSSAKEISARDVLPYVWACVTVCMLVFFTVRYTLFFRSVKKGIKGDDGILYLDGIDSPFVIGIFKPVLCVPNGINDLEKDYIMHHENLHIKNHDGLIKLVCYLILCIHWFNPLVWAAFLMVCADLEMRVDEEVIDGLGIELKKAYCRSIVNHAVNDPAGSFMQNTAFSGIGFGGMEAKMRVTNLLKNKKASKKIQAVAILISLTVAVMASACSFDFGSKAAQNEETEVTVNGIVSDTEQTAAQSETESSESPVEETTGATSEASSESFPYYISDDTPTYESYYVESDKYTFSDDGLSGTFNLHTFDSYTREYVESLAVGDTLPDGTVIESIVEYTELGGICINDYERYFMPQENGEYILCDWIGQGFTTELDERTYPISPDVVIIDNTDPFRAEGILIDEYTKFYDMQYFMTLLESDSIWVRPDLYIRVENGEVTMIVVNPWQHQPWRDV
ncbi:MAG: hypothetical protein J5685_01740 [Clostridiales bacterium]|nr:hypothetical protein [Clostridiales bacterium]